MITLVAAFAVLSGLGLAAAAVWPYGSLWALAPALVAVGFGLTLNDDRMSE